MSDPRGSQRTARGFTLIEVMIALVILAFGMLTLAVMQLQSLRQGSQGRHTGDGTAIARSYLEQTNRLPWAELTTAVGGAFVDPDWDFEPDASMVVARPSGGTATEKSYTIVWRVTNVDGPPVCLRDVEVSVTWTEEGSSTSKTHVIGTRRYNTGDPNC